MRLSFSGRSDDIVQIAIDGTAVDEVDALNKPILIVFWHQGDGRCELEIKHGQRGWASKLSLHDDFDDGEDLPEFKVSASECGYSQEWSCELDELWRVEVIDPKDAEEPVKWAWPVERAPLPSAKGAASW